MNSHFYLAIFVSKNKAVFLSTVLESNGYKSFKLVSAPCSIREGCNYAIKFSNKNNLNIILSEAAKLEMKPPSIYLLDTSRGGQKYRKINI